MKITKISKLKKFGIYEDFSWGDLSDFKRFNLIYGWNRSGKTTLSRVFASCEKKQIYDENKFEQYPEKGEFEIKTDNGITIKDKNIDASSLPIKVFNQDFIDDNISFDPSDSCNPIIYVSEEDIESKKKIEQLKKDKVTLSEKYKQAQKARSTKEEIKSNFLTGLGREIANILFDKGYNKINAENKINSIGFDNFVDKSLSDEDRKKYESISKSDAGKTQELLSDYSFSFSFEGKIFTDFKKVHEKVNELLSKKVVSEVIERLKNDQILNNWVKQGFDLHKIKKEKESCLFCQKPLDHELLTSLSNHFNEDYESLQTSIANLKKELLRLKINRDKSHLLGTRDNLYPDLQKGYVFQSTQLEEAIDKINIWIDKATQKLEEKYNNALLVISPLDEPEDFLSSYSTIIKELNKIINLHNEKIKNHADEVSLAREKLELNSIANALSEQDYKKMITDLEEAKTEEKEALDKVNQNSTEIEKLEKQTSNIGTAITAINKHLIEFFGRKEIELALDKDKKGYEIRRDGKPAKNLSEGEKTAVAFSYFVVKVGEGDFDKSAGIIFIDDPISSFDSNFIYHCYSMINTHFNEVGQLFVSTHNFQLFNLIKHWFIKKNEKQLRKSKTRESSPCEFFMVENFIQSESRRAKIVPLDKTLLNYKSEYHFLFAKLREFSEKVRSQYEDFYTIGNMARRFFDIFADFKVPNTGDEKSKMEVLVSEINSSGEEISAVDAEKAYKLINDFSHNSDPTSAIEHKDKGESKDAIKILLNIVKKADPKHYQVLEKSIK